MMSPLYMAFGCAGAAVGLSSEAAGSERLEQADGIASVEPVDFLAVKVPTQRLSS